MASAPEAREDVGETFLQGAEESGITKRPLLRRTLLLAAAPLGVAPLVLLRDLGPLPTNQQLGTPSGGAKDGKPAARRRGNRRADPRGGLRLPRRHPHGRARGRTSTT